MVMAPVVRGRKGEFEKLFEQFRLEGYSRVRRWRAPPPRRGDQARQEVQPRHLGRRRPARDEERPCRAAPSRSRRRRRLPVAWSRSTSSASQVAMRPRAKVSTEMTGRRAPRARRAPASCRPTSPTGSPSASGPRASTAVPRSPSSSRGSSPSTRRTAPASAATGSASSEQWTPIWSCRPGRPLGGSGRSRGASTLPLLEALVEAVAEDYVIDLDAPWQELSDEDKDFPAAPGRRAPQGHLHEPLRATSLHSVRFEGIVNNLERRYEETDSDGVRERVEGYMAEQPRLDCKGARAAAGEPRGQGRGFDPRYHGLRPRRPDLD